MTCPATKRVDATSPGGCWLRSIVAMLALGIVFHVRAASAQILPGFDDPRWSASNGVWEIGVPSSGPGSCHGGTQCAATVLAGNYDPNTDSRLESPSVDLPAIGAGEELQLRFWQWFSYSFSDNGTVQIAVFDPATQTFGSWQNVASAVGLYSSVVWSRRIVDLSTFAGKRVRIGFFHNATDDGNVSGPDNGLGWYLDDLTIEVVTPAFTGDFENGWGDWSASNGVWEIGVPSSGPGSCHGGTQCAATVLAGNYDPNTDSRLESPSVDLPAIGAGEELQLRFWQWFSYSFSDNGTVQIAVFDPATQTFGSWQNVASAVGLYSSVVWSRRIVDLSTFAGKRVRIGFFHNAADDGNVSGPDNGLGWYIDDLTIEVVTPAFTGDFECGWGDWSASNGVWEIGVPSSGPGSCHGGTQCAATVLGGNYDPNTDSRLETPPIDLPVIGAAEELQLRFWQWFSYSFSDNGTVQIAVFDPATQTFGDWQSIATPVGGFGSVTWTSRSVDVGTFAGKRVRFGFFHNAADDGNVSGPDVSSGWYIDDICLVGPGPNVQCFPCTGPTATPHPLTPSPTPSTSPIVTATATPAVTATSGATPTNPITPTALSPSTTATATPNPSQTPSAMPTCPPAAECVVGTVGKGGTVTTDTENDDTTPDDPVETWVMPPIGCTIGIIEAPLPPGRTTTNGFQFLGQEIDINAACDDSPEVNPGAPLRIVIDVNLSQLGTQQRQKPLTLDLFRNGCPVLPCTGDVDVAYPSPCWVDKQLVQDGDAVRFTVLTAKASTWNTGNALDAFLCHQAKPSASAPKFTATDVSLAIDGAVRVFAVPAVGALCNPADLQGGGILDDEAHLQSFKTKLAKVCASQRTLCRTAKDCNSGEACVNQDPLTTAAPEVVRDGFGVLVLDAQAPQEVRVPSAKAEGAMPAPLDPQAHTVPPFACGKVKVRKGVCVRDTTRACKTDGDCGDAGPCSATPARRVVSVKDQFTVDPVVFVLGQPTVLCSPVAFGGVTEVNDLSHLLCYRAKRARKECANTLTANSAIVCRKEEDCGGISRNTQFCASQSPADTVVVGVQALLGSPIELERDATKEVELCVPATVD